MTVSTVIEFKEIWKVFSTANHSVEALKGVSLTIDAGEMVSVMGQSGCGKSSFLNILGLLSNPTRGDYYFNGEDVFCHTDKQLALFRNRYIGFVFQAAHLLPTMSAHENVALPLSYAGFSKAKAYDRARVLLDRVGLLERLNHRPSELSGGQQQRVAIARAMSNSPQLLVADEPTGALDNATSKDILAIFRDLNTEDNVTIVVVTHDSQVSDHCHRNLVMQDGMFV